MRKRSGSERLKKLGWQKRLGQLCLEGVKRQPSRLHKLKRAKVKERLLGVMEKLKPRVVKDKKTMRKRKKRSRADLSSQWPRDKSRSRPRE